MSNCFAGFAQGGLGDLKELLLRLDISQALEYFGLGTFDTLLKSTISLCPECLCYVPALVYTYEKRVWMQKRCPHHAFSTALLENDESFYHLSNKDQWGRRYASATVLEFPLFTCHKSETAACSDD